MNLGGRYLTGRELEDKGFRSLGDDVRVHERASLYGTGNISLGAHARIDDYAVIVASGPVTLGSYVSIANFCFLGGRHGIEIGDFVTFAPGVQIFSAEDDYSGRRMTGPLLPREYTGGGAGKVVVGRHVIIGAGSVVLAARTIGEGVAVGALSLVKEDCAPWGVYAGIPARRIAERAHDLERLERQFLGGGP